MLLAAGEILQRGAVAFRGQSAQIHLQALMTVLDAGLVGTFSEHFLHLGVGHEFLERRGGAGTGDEKIEIAHGFTAAAETAGRGDFLDIGRGEIFGQFRGDALREAEQETTGALAIPGDRPQNFFFQLRAHARQFAKFLFAAKALQIVDGGAAVIFEQQADAFGSESLDLQKLERAGGIFFEHLVATLETAALLDLSEDEGDAFADAGDFGHLAVGILENR